jgi:hypothetical protein
MKWTHKLPTQAGWYWSKFIPFGKKRETAIVVLRVVRNGAKKLRVNGQSLESMCQYGERLWAGPLEPPNASAVED